MTTPLTTLGAVQAILGINQTDSASINLCNLYLTRATAAICDWCKRKDFGLYTVTEPLSGNNAPSFTVRQIPVNGVTVNGLTATAGSSVLTGFPTVASMANLFVGQSLFCPGFNVPVAIQAINGPSLTLSQAATATATGVALTDSTQTVSFTGNTTSGSVTVANVSATAGLNVGDTITGSGIPGGTTISAVNTGSLAVMGSSGASATATTTTNGPVQFSIALYADNNAFGGTAPGSFGPTTVLCEGGDFYLDWDDFPGGVCSSGVVYRIGYYWWRPPAWYSGLISAQVGPPTLNLKVKYLAGYSAVPTAVTAACELLIARMRLSRKAGTGIDAMSRDGLSVTLAKNDKTDNSSPLGLFTPEIRALLSPYQKVIVTEN